MPVQAGWILQDRIIGIKFEGKITDSDIDTLDAFVNHANETSTAPQMHVIVSTGVDTEQTSLKKLLQMKSVRNKRGGWTITIGLTKNPAAQFLVRSIITMFQIRHRDAASFEDAIKVLQKVDPSLPQEEIESNLQIHF